GARDGGDRRRPQALMRGGVWLLARWGLLGEVIDGGAPPLRTTTFFYGDKRVDVAVKLRYGIDALVAPRRTLLDPILVRAARRAGAEVRHRTGVMSLRFGPGGRVRGAILDHA